jgi:hypothetical protein
MNELIEQCRALSDTDLTRELGFLAERERRNLTGLLIHLGEYDRRRLPERTGQQSTFMYCVRVLHYDEGGAYRRVHAARVLRRYPAILPQITKGSLTLTSLLLLSPILNETNSAELFREADGKTKREIEMIVARRDPRPPMPDHARRFPAPPPWIPRPASSEPSPPAPPPAVDDAAPAGQYAEVLPRTPPHEWQAIVPLAVDRVRIGFDAGIAVMSLIDRARQILRHKYPAGRLEDLVKEALELLLDRKDPQRRLTLKPAQAVRDAAALPADAPRFLRARAAGRYIPAWVKRAAWERDGGRCAWREADGTVCGSKDWLEYDHLRPFAKGGRSDSPRNVRLLCRAHNAEAARAAGLSAAAPAS